ncbi:MAG: tRNA (guanosine(37)-N1)-methyltransferase TrmD [Patescibacteria group bacterium]|jgi:tRNA (guanine37-N1)-methyltransferase
MRIDIITIFPDFFDQFLEESILARALKKKLISIRVWDLRLFTEDKHRTVDDRPYSGGPGMLMKVDVLVRALREVVGSTKTIGVKGTRVLFMDAGGEQFTQKTAVQFSKLDRLVLLCGRYEGVDARVMDYVDGRVSIGPYVLNGGEVAAMAVVEASMRLLPGVLGHEDSAKDESHSEEGVLEYPQYTRPEEFEGKKVPEILLSGDHAKIAAWRKQQKRKRT